MIEELKYSNTNTYLISGDRGYILFDTGWAGTFDMFLKALGEKKIKASDIKYIMISHFHPDHMGIAQNIANLGADIIVFDVQKDYIHFADEIFSKDKRLRYTTIEDESVKYVDINNSREFLKQAGFDGQVYHTPGHSDDSVSLYLDDGSLFVGDLNPLYELELHEGTEIGESWKRLLSLDPCIVYYGHAKTAVLKENQSHSINSDKTNEKLEANDQELYSLVRTIMKLIDKGRTLDFIQKKTGADKVFIEDVTRMYLTHQNVGVQGILDRIEIKGK